MWVYDDRTSRLGPRAHVIQHFTFSGKYWTNRNVSAEPLQIKDIPSFNICSSSSKVWCKTTKVRMKLRQPVMPNDNDLLEYVFVAQKLEKRPTTLELGV
jgi:hypothetical protein